MAKNAKLPILLGIANFRTREFKGVWKFSRSGNEDKLYDEELAERDIRDETGLLEDWLKNNSIETTGRGFMFQGANRASCIIEDPQLEVISIKAGFPPSIGCGEYRLPYKTACTYRQTIKVRWQPIDSGIPAEIGSVLDNFGYSNLH